MRAQHLRSDRFPTPDGLAISRVFLRHHLLFAMTLFALFALIFPTQPALAITVLSNPAGVSNGNYQLTENQYYAVKFTVPPSPPGMYPGYRIDSATVNIMNNPDRGVPGPYDVYVDLYKDGGMQPGALVGRLGTETTTPNATPLTYTFNDNPLPVQAGFTYWLVVTSEDNGGSELGIATTNSLPSGLFTYNGYYHYDALNPQ